MHGRCNFSRDTAGTISQKNVEIIERAIAAVNDRDIDAYLACCTRDVQLRTPMTPIEGAYEGAEGIRRFFSDVAASAPDFRIEIERVEAAGANRVLTFLHIRATGRESGVDMGRDTANVYDLVEGKIKRIEIFLDREKALEAAGLSE